MGAQRCTTVYRGYETGVSSTDAPFLGMLHLPSCMIFSKTALDKAITAFEKKFYKSPKKNFTKENTAVIMVDCSEIERVGEDIAT